MSKRGKVVCLECGGEFKLISYTHLKYVHNMTYSEYLMKHLGAETMSKELLEKHRQNSLEAQNLPDVKRRHRKACKEAQNRPKVVEKKRRNALAAWSRPGVMEKQQQSIRRAVNRIGVREKHRQSALRVMKEVHNRPAVRKKHSEAASRLILEGRIGPPHGKRGRFFSKKSGKEIYYQSSYELVAFELLEQMSEVISFGRGPAIPYLWEDGSRHLYLADFLVVYRSGRLEVIEVKAKWALEHEDNPTKFAAARDYCEQNGMTFVVWTEENLN